MAIIVGGDSWACNLSCARGCIGSDGGRSMKLLASGGNGHRRGADGLVGGGRGNGSIGGRAHGIGPKDRRGASGTGDPVDVGVVVPVLAVDVVVVAIAYVPVLAVAYGAYVAVPPVPPVLVVLAAVPLLPPVYAVPPGAYV